jgi:hypothetical protein
MSNQTLIEKIRKARETLIYEGGFGFMIRRPTDLEIIQMRGQSIRESDVMRLFVVDWRDVTEADLIPGGSPVRVPFDSELFMEWVADRPQFWAPIVNAVMASYQSHQESMESAVGEQKAG